MNLDGSKYLPRKRAEARDSGVGERSCGPEIVAVLSSGGERGPSFQHDQPFDVVGQVGEPDLGTGAVEPDGADEALVALKWARLMPQPYRPGLGVRSAPRRRVSGVP